MPYLKKIGSLKKRIILSTGMSNLNEIQSAIKKYFKKMVRKKKQITLLHCNTEYPANPKKTKFTFY